MKRRKTNRFPNLRQYELEREVVGHALALTHYLNYIGPRNSYEAHYQKLFKATGALREYMERHQKPISK